MHLTRAKAKGLGVTVPSYRECEAKLKECRVLKTSCDFASLLEAAFERENARVLDEDDEDDLDGWELESEVDEHEDAEALVQPSSSPLAPAVDAAEETAEASAADRKRTRRGGRKKRAANPHTQERQKAFNKKRKIDAKQKEKEEQSADPRKYTPSTHALKKAEQAKVLQTEYDVSDLHAANGGFIGKRLTIQRADLELARLQGEGYELFKWDGRTTHALADKHDKCFGLLAGQPDDPTWQDTVRGAAEALREAKEKVNLGRRVDRRGNFGTIAYGVSYGGGQRRPGNLRHSANNEAAMKELCENTHIVRMSNFARSMFKIYFPELYNDYAETLQALYDGDPKLRHIFKGGCWPAMSANFPPNAYTRSHTDTGNKANGMCPIFSLGDFDPTNGGQLVLPDLKLIIEFPPGSLIFIPSATLLHGNIPVREGESRTSWTQYAAGGLFRWMRYGGCSWETLKKSNKKLAEEELARRGSNWQEAVRHFPTVESLRQRGSRTDPL